MTDARHSRQITVRDVQEKDGAAWARLYTGYRSFYHLPVDDEAVATTWRWVLGGEHGLHGLVAAGTDDEPIALANLRLFARPSAGAMAFYLDDLFTAADARGTGAATALLERAAELAADEGAVVVRWITADDNATARRVYDRHATLTPFVTYDMKPAER